jgi:hypothetical protein
MKLLRPLIATFVLSTVAAHAATVVPPLPTKEPGSIAILLGVDSVQKELKLNSLQRAVLNDIRNDYRDDARKVTAKVAAGKETKAEGKAEIASLTLSSERRALRSLNADQRQRLKEIEFQVLGAYMLLSGDVQKQLGLTPKQKSKIAYVWWYGERKASKINEKFEKGTISNNERLMELHDNRTYRADDMLERLTKEQRAQLDKMAGAKFNSLS